MTVHLGTCYRVEVDRCTETGDLVVPVPESIIEYLNLDAGDEILWSPNEDGSFSILKVPNNIGKRIDVTKKALDNFRQALLTSRTVGCPKGVHPLIHQASRDAIEGQIEDLERELLLLESKVA